MNDKFLREARNYAHIFCVEYKIDPDLARFNLKECLKDKRRRVRDLTYKFIKDKIHGRIDG